MDDTLKHLIESHAGKKVAMRLQPTDGTIEIVIDDQEPGQIYTVKPLPELYGKGTGLGSVEFTNETFFPLLIAIEESFLHSIRQRSLRADSAIIAVLNRLCMSPETDVSKDPVAQALQFDLRVALSLNDYSRSDVCHALKKIRQSATRHNKQSGPQGYLAFIMQQLGKR